MDNYIDLKKLGYDELAGVVNLYPWFGAARKELCRRMAADGGESWGKSQYADAAMYVADRGEIASLLRETQGCADKDVQAVLKSYIEEKPVESTGDQRPVRVVGGDFFSQSQYDKVKKADDNVFSRFTVKAVAEDLPKDEKGDFDGEFCTETLARIYEEQGYFEYAKRIYSRLLLKFPEKNTYFAALIRKLEQEVCQ